MSQSLVNDTSDYYEEYSCVPGEVRYDDGKTEKNFSFIAATTPLVINPGWEIALKVIFYMLAMLVDLVGNSIVIMIILLNRKMRTTTNLLLLNLAVSDLMVGMFCMWVHMGNQITPNWPFGPFMCRFSSFTQVMSVTASVLTLTVISVERFIAVVYPFRRHWTPTVTGIIVGCTWVLAIATGSPHLAVRRQMTTTWSDRVDVRCEEKWTAYYTDDECRYWMYGRFVYYVVEGVVMYFVPVAIIIVTYTMIAFKLLMRKAPGSVISSTSSAQEKSKRKVTKMLVIVMVVFMICWSPQQILLLYDVIGSAQTPDYYPIIRYIAIYIAYFNSALNPVLYGGFNENFRNGFSEAFRCFLIQKRNKIGPESMMPQHSGKPHSGEDGDSRCMKSIPASQITTCPGHSRELSGYVNPQNGYLQPIPAASQRKIHWSDSGQKQETHITDSRNPQPDSIHPMNPPMSEHTLEVPEESKA